MENKNDGDLKLTGPELQVELLKRMGYSEESRKCENCKHFVGVYSATSECLLIPIMQMKVNGGGYCNYHKFNDESE
jgi:hypothetical protein